MFYDDYNFSIFTKFMQFQIYFIELYLISLQNHCVTHDSGPIEKYWIATS